MLFQGYKGSLKTISGLFWALNSLFAWAVFFLAYTGIRLSGVRLFEVIDGH